MKDSRASNATLVFHHGALKNSRIASQTIKCVHFETIYRVKSRENANIADFWGME